MFNNLITLVKGDGRRMAVAPDSVRSVTEDFDEEFNQPILRIAMMTGQQDLIVVGDFDKTVDQINAGRKDD